MNNSSKLLTSALYSEEKKLQYVLNVLYNFTVHKLSCDRIYVFIEVPSGLGHSNLRTLSVHSFFICFTYPHGLLPLSYFLMYDQFHKSKNTFNLSKLFSVNHTILMISRTHLQFCSCYLYLLTLTLIGFNISFFQQC